MSFGQFTTGPSESPIVTVTVVTLFGQIPIWSVTKLPIGNGVSAEALSVSSSNALIPLYVKSVSVKLPVFGAVLSTLYAHPSR